ncbi:kinesin-domain-containing protein [Pisolithus marmoratus]|nr:kinesin-domain-containing protein [Pisolithus marmoratus]
MAPPPSSSTPTSSGSTTSVQVAVRIRPTTSQDAASIPARFQRIVVHATSHTSVAIDASSTAPTTSGSATAVVTPTTPTAKKQVFSFDQVHSPDTTQHALFTSTALPLISRFLEGFNCTVLAYGQTSSGKTFTMTGMDLDANPSDPHNGMGIIPRAVSTIFSQSRKLKEERGASWNYTIKGSFIEIYNEDLIDLLSSDDTGGVRREVQIREAKDGSIIWGGLREVTVRSNAEVMNLIRQGTSIRRTNETDMNAQSSRSHAIFSLTLTQKKYTGSGLPPRSSSPLPPSGRSPSRLARPGSLHTSGSPSAARVSSPIPGRPSTPSFQTAMGRGAGLRPASSLGLRPPDGRADVPEDDAGGWTTIVSKFHFVDLAGSERLKRTSAAGDRIKEGISINSGLLALGNVISALGDPSRSKSHTNSHVPYRDSKLTRLLQDSLGGNAHTMMIACVSPTEWNVGETVNTLKYANRARNIKNRVTVNEKEDGWDDIEWLQGTVTRLRKELKQLKDGGAIVPPGSHEPGAHISESTESPNKRMLQQMSELQNNYEDLREKYVERTEELARLRRELGERHRQSSGGSVGGTAKYEEIVGPVIEEYEKTISAMEAELGLNRAALRLTNEMVEEKEEELSQLTERHVATELYVEELRTRLVKLGEREASTEAYVRDLEDKMKSYDETSVSSSESLSDLKREVARYKEAEAHSITYITDLETRLARADESILSLQQSVEHLEREGERRREEVVTLQTRLENFKNDGENWRTDLEEREKKVRELELRMEEWKQKRREAGEDRARLGTMIGEVEQAKRSLEDLTTTKSGISNPSSGVQTPTKIDLSVETQLAALQQTHAATLTDLASVSAKYRDALQEIADLAAQIQEAKLSNPTIPESPSENVEVPTFRRKMTASKSREALRDPAQLDASGKRHFFRQAASSDSLHAKSLSQSLSPSVSLSQELSLARSRRISGSSHGTSSPISQSPSLHHSNLSLSLSSANGGSTPTEHRSIVSMEREVMRLQEVLKEREAEISALEISLKEKEQIPVTPPVATVSNDVVDPSTHLSPTTAQKFEAIRRSMALHGVSPLPNGASPDTEVDESLDRLNELMLSMAQKESQHQELVDSLNQQLARVRRAHDELVILSRDQALNMSTELEGLRLRHDNTLEELENLRQREQDLLESIKRADVDHAAAMEVLRSDHQQALDAKSKEVDEYVARVKDEHQASLGSLQGQLDEANAALEKTIREHEEKLGKLRAEHESELQLSLQEASSTLQRLDAEHQAAFAKLSAEHEAAMKSKGDAAAADLHRTEEEYYNALTKLRNDHAEVLQKQADEATAMLERLREDHASEMRVAEKARECSLSESESARDQALRELQEEHASAIARKETLYAEDIERLKAEHARILSSKEEDYRSRRENMKMEHATAMAVLREQSEAQIESLTKAFQQLEQEAAASATKAREEYESTIQALQGTHTAALEELACNHDDEIAQLKASQERVLQATLAKAEEEHKSLSGSHSDAIAKLQAEHEAISLAARCALEDAQEKHRIVLEEVQATAVRQLTEERGRSATTLAELEQRHSALCDELEKGRAALRKELDAVRADVKVAEDHHRQELEIERQRSALALEELQIAHSSERETLLKDVEHLRNELESHQTMMDKVGQAQREHERAMSEKTQLLATIQEDMTNVRLEKDQLRDEVEKLKAELAGMQTQQTKLVQEASKRRSLTDELEKHRSLIAEMQESLQRVKDEKDTLQAEKTRQENALRDLQVQIARSSTAPDTQSSKATPDRSLSFTRINNLNGKLPPPTPPPSVPPPPAPKPQDCNFSVSTQFSVISPSSSRDSQTTDSPATSVLSINVPGVPPLDTKAEAMIKTLNKQLSHCESDLATHMDLVGTLETSLSESEKNLRKARMQATELVRERDSLNLQLEGLRSELQEAHREVATVRKSIVEEKQSLESRLDEERRAKERARAQLDSRMEEIQRRKSKFACL